MTLLLKDEKERNPATLSEALSTCMDGILSAMQQGAFLRGAVTGFEDLDDALLGMGPGELVVVGSRPSVGKSAFAHNVALNMAKSGLRVLVVSMEMSAADVACRMACAEARCSLLKLRAGVIRDEDMAKLREAADALAELKLVIMDDEDVGVEEISKLVNGEGFDVVVVDNLQMLEPGDAVAQYFDRRVEVDTIVRDLKRMARLFAIPVIATSQVNRADSRRDAKPKISSLRESGEIEHSADVVILLDRSLSSEEAWDSNRPELGLVEVIVAKNRNGEVGNVWLEFDAEQARFSDYVREERY